MRDDFISSHALCLDAITYLPLANNLQLIEVNDRPTWQP